MTTMVLIILAVIWAAVLLPPLFQNRSEGRPSDSISTFRNQLTVLERRGGPSGGGSFSGSLGNVRSNSGAGYGRPIGSASTRGSIDHARFARMDAKKRRRDILAVLIALNAVTLLLSFVLAPARMAFVGCAVLLVAYVGLLLNQKKVAEERIM